MAEVELLILVVPFVEWKVDDPAVGDFVGIFEIEMIGEGNAKLAEDFVDFVACISTEEDRIASFGVSEFCDGGYLGVGHKLKDRRFGAFIGV